MKMYPIEEDYNTAIKNLGHRLNKLKTLSLSYVPQKSNKNEPFRYSGNFSVVYKLKDKNDNYYAIKCFTRQIQDGLFRYKKISECFEQLNCDYFVNYEYLENELYINRLNQDAPILKMSWVNGKTLGIAVQEACEKDDTEVLIKIYSEWDDLCKYLLENQIAHGDLKDDNIIVTPDNKLVVIDYDGIYVPALSHLKALDSGSPAYQHPKRNDNIYNEDLDHFSMLVLKISFYALIKYPDLFIKYRQSKSHRSESILFSKKDFVDIHHSSLIADIETIKDTYLTRMMQELKKSCCSDSISIHNIYELMNVDFMHSSSITINKISLQLNTLSKQQMNMNKKIEQLFQIFMNNQYADKRIIEKLKIKTCEKLTLINDLCLEFLSENPLQNKKQDINKLIDRSIYTEYKQIESQIIKDANDQYWAFSDNVINQRLNNLITNQVFDFFVYQFDKLIKYHSKISIKRGQPKIKLEEKRNKYMENLGIEKMKINIGHDTFSSVKHIEKKKAYNYSKPDNVILNVLSNGYIFRETGEILKKSDVLVNCRF